MKNYQEKLQEAFVKIKKAHNILLVSHVSPDADAISSLGALIELISSLGIKYYAFSAEKKAGEYNFIPNSEKINSFKPYNLNDFDLIITCDCGSIKRTSLEDELKEIIQKRNNKKIPFIIEIDHHEKVDDYADLEIRRQDKASTSLMIYDLLKENNWPLSKKISNCILSGLVGDTGCFLHSNSSAEAIAVASETLNYGASFNMILKASTKNSNFLSLKIWGKIIDNLHFNSDSGLLSSGISEQEMESLKKENNLLEENSSADLFGIITSFLCSLSGVKVALLLRESDGFVKGSLRTSRHDIDVSEIAARFGGGGHKKAAGFSLKGYLKKTETGWKVKRT